MIIQRITKTCTTRIMNRSSRWQRRSAMFMSAIITGLLSPICAFAATDYLKNTTETVTSNVGQGSTFMYFIMIAGGISLLIGILKRQIMPAVISFIVLVIASSAVWLVLSQFSS